MMLDVSRLHQACWVGRFTRRHRSWLVACMVSVVSASSLPGQQPSGAPVLRAPDQSTPGSGTRRAPESLPSTIPESLPLPPRGVPSHPPAGSSVWSPTPTTQPPALMRSSHVDPSEVIDRLHQDFFENDSETTTELQRIFDGLDKMNAQFHQQMEYQRTLKAELERARREAERQQRLFEEQVRQLPSASPPPAVVAQPPEEAEPVPPPSDTPPAEVVESAPPAAPETIPAPNPDPLPVGPNLVAAKAVDRPRLADSLYGSEQYELALRIYRDLSKDEERIDDRIWYYYQMAGCLRHMEEPSQAAKFYRTVAGAGGNDYLASQSKWWLQHLEKNTQLAEAVTGLRAAFANLEREETR